MFITTKTISATGEQVCPARQHHGSQLEKIVILTGIVSLLATTGCVFREDRDHPGDPGHHEVEKDSDHSGVDHGEFPGDQDHNQNR